MDLPLLRAIVAVANELHFGRAADSLGITQPQVSHRVRKAEDELGLRLFERDRHGVSITAAGRQMLTEAREVCAAAERLSTRADGLRAGHTGTVTVGAVGSAFFGALPQLLESCHRRFPSINLQMTEMESPEQADALSRRQIDIGFMRPPAPHKLWSQLVWSEPLFVALPEKHPLFRRDKVHIDDIVDEPVVLFPRDSGPGYWDLVASLFEPNGKDLQPAAEADHVTTVLGLVALRIGITFVPASAQALHLPGVCYRPVEGAPRLELVAATQQASLLPAVRRVVETLPSL